MKSMHTEAPTDKLIRPDSNTVTSLIRESKIMKPITEKARKKLEFRKKAVDDVQVSI